MNRSVLDPAVPDSTVGANIFSAIVMYRHFLSLTCERPAQRSGGRCCERPRDASLVNEILNRGNSSTVTSARVHIQVHVLIAVRVQSLIIRRTIGLNLKVLPPCIQV
jgi:hypothetical protein